MGHYSDLYDAQEAQREREAQLEATSTLANDAAVLLTQFGALVHRLKKEGYHQLAWERLHNIVSDLRSVQADSKNAREIAIAITHIETAILWLKK